MGILPIVLYGNAVLRKKAKPVKAQDDIKELVQDMFETMHNAHGIGLAAPQIGKSIRLLVVDVSKVKDYENEQPLVIINPQILEDSREQCVMEEGCLSIPKLRGDVKRPEAIKLKYRDENFELKTEVFDDLFARVIMHEIDHLDGVLFVDRMRKSEAKDLKQDLERIATKGVKGLSYPTIPNLVEA